MQKDALESGILMKVGNDRVRNKEVIKQNGGKNRTKVSNDGKGLGKRRK